MSFIQLLKAGLVKCEDIDDYIDTWHTRTLSFRKDHSLYVFLGMTKTQYHEWLINPDYLKELANGNDS